MNKLSIHKKYYIIEIKDWSTFEVPEESWKKIWLQRADPNNNLPIVLWESFIHQYELRSVKPKLIINDIDAYILSQKKPIRDKINQYQESKNITWNSIEHVSNFIESLTNS